MHRVNLKCDGVWNLISFWGEESFYYKKNNRDCYIWEEIRRIGNYATTIKI